MSSTATSTTSNSPSAIATQLATASIQDTQNLLNTQSQNAQAVSTGLSKLQSALQAFDNTLSSLASTSTKSLAQYSATFGTTGFGSATASSTALPGTYSVFVQQIASANQIAFNNLPSAAVTSSSSAGTLTVTQKDGTSFGVSLDSTADTDGDGQLSPAEIARAINQASGNAGKVSAMVITAGTQSRLVLSAANTGANSLITLDTSQVTNAGLKAALGGTPSTIVPAQDAIAYVGGDATTGLKQQQASNTFTNIPGVSMTFTQAQAATDAPLALTVASDDAGTAANVQKFVDAYNALNKALAPLTVNASADGSTPAGTFATDSGVSALRTSLGNLVRQQVGGLSLLKLGISIDRNGVMSLDQTKLKNAQLANPNALDTVFGNTGLVTSSGILGSLDKYMQSWTNVTNGQITLRQASVQSQQKSIQDRMTRLNDQYTQAYNRYLKQFTQLQTLQAQMSQTSNMFF
jgi:flagellar hook-associated protein 2